jgi:hypothetical protein
MNVRTLVERVLCESQDEFVQLVEQKLMKVLAEHREQGISASAGRAAAPRALRPVASATTRAKQVAHPVARSRDATLASLLAAFVVLEEAAAGGSA